ncbi:hypothetical protein COW36_25000 [bacterium (Candidatus Blackallbacteria) CG17_big_fil_post_rev_8_21_14_2_50_48_46]|uniref:Uncharacterized protein n=1 Tax=bacterium (Candidatus Blackallbacteria) CG17_big_fil_post_rev_8_21_14_2_50_48_46 TaxID=2014261 RepID=A0A2M7FX37_9BACT|nr:MAG: hypothetical protein COW64_08005 [bacterium (Candidatus Blackallbacteria) CG18_big_fil_WC_8_21_14_2_50_49_26]PIW13663.1 MAG: hypothetical protein COW36_25000 [bacterium (Candidatus Blackallbacteria) CG17_big_fil_post_rev_8_21_14_2_50_48_46]PIW51162.1 MAG: hypothetical protein COW20_00105 [bacterium (Candidatus Blackallbacteria) CG13_big_fil_rev_8_21_14_2_50_49_14]
MNMALNIPQDADAFDYGYSKGFEDYMVGNTREQIKQNGSQIAVAYALGYELGYDHAVAYLRNREEAYQPN